MLLPASPLRVSSFVSNSSRSVRTVVLISSIHLPKGLNYPCESRNSLTADNSHTNEDGRCLDLLPPAGSELAQKENTELIAGQIYKVVFKTKEYFDRSNRKSFYPWVEVTGGNLLNLFATQIYQITFTIEEPAQHYHIPLLISPYAFTTYRGS